MPRFILAATLVGVVAATALAGVVVKGSSSQEALGASNKCTNASLAGAFGVKFEGQSPLGQFASVSLWKFDGRGGLRAAETFNSAQTGPQTRRISGKYTMKSDCSFQLLFGSELVRSHEADGACVLTAKGSEFICLDNEKGWQTVGSGTKV